MRRYILALYESLSAHDEFKEVELGVFPWFPWKHQSSFTTEQAALTAAGSAPRTFEAFNNNFIIRSPPPRAPILAPLLVTGELLQHRVLHRHPTS